MRTLRHLRQRFMLTCEEVNHFLVQYVEGTLDDRLQTRFERHVARCAQCSTYLKQYRETVHLTREASTADLAHLDDTPDELVELTLSFLRQHADFPEGDAPDEPTSPSGAE